MVHVGVPPLRVPQEGYGSPTWTALERENSTHLAPSRPVLRGLDGFFLTRCGAEPPRREGIMPVREAVVGGDGLEPPTSSV